MLENKWFPWQCRWNYKILVSYKELKKYRFKITLIQLIIKGVQDTRETVQQSIVLLQFENHNIAELYNIVKV